MHIFKTIKLITRFSFTVRISTLFYKKFAQNDKVMLDFKKTEEEMIQKSLDTKPNSFKVHKS